MMPVASVVKRSRSLFWAISVHMLGLQVVPPLDLQMQIRLPYS
jgi:hypothetical protein